MCIVAEEGAEIYFGWFSNSSTEEERPRPRPLDESQNFLSLLNVLEVTSLPLKYTALVNNIIRISFPLKTVLTVSLSSQCVQFTATVQCSGQKFQFYSKFIK